MSKEVTNLVDVVGAEVKHPTDLDGRPNHKRNYCYSCGTTVKDQKYCHGCGRKLLWFGCKNPEAKVVITE